MDVGGLSEARPPLTPSRLAFRIIVLWSYEASPDPDRSGSVPLSESSPPMRGFAACPCEN